jgi:putative transposase
VTGPEFSGRALEAWVYRYWIELRFIRPGKPIEQSWLCQIQRAEGAAL